MTLHAVVQANKSFYSILILLKRFFYKSKKALFIWCVIFDNFHHELSWACLPRCSTHLHNDMGCGDNCSIGDI